MTSGKNLTIGILAVAMLGLGVVAWRQHQELIALRAASLTPKERANWQKRVWAAEKQRGELEQKVAALSEKSGPPDAPDAAPVEMPRGRPGRGGFMAMMDNPEVQRLLAVQQKAALDQRYSSLFKSLNLTPQQLEQFKNLLVEKSTAMMDVLSAARAQGINPRTDRQAFQQLVTNAQADVDSSIRSTIGDTAFAQYQQYEATLPQRNVVNQLEQRLSYSPTPLNQTQADQLVQIMASTSPTNADPNNPRAIFAGAAAALGRGNGPGSTITDATISQAAGVLAAPQVDALKQLQQEQQAQAQLAAAFRAQIQGNRSGGAAGTPVPAPAPAPGK